MKIFEAKYDFKIEPQNYFCVRLDGNKFSNFTRKFEKPYDVRFSQAMVMTTIDTINKFGARTGFTQSDEITLIFDKAIPEDFKQHITYNHLFNGRVSKLLSIVSSYVSVRFNHHFRLLTSNLTNIYNQETLELINGETAIFDARILEFDENNKYEMLNHLIWRSVKDCYRNAVQTYAHHIFGPAKIKYLNREQMIQLIEENTNIVWSNIPLWQKYGVIIKKQLIKTDSIRNNVKNSVITSSFKVFSLKLSYNDEMLKFLFDKYFEPNKISEYQLEDYPLSII
ncbi:putative tRNA(his) guanylyltransferase [Acanthamoeba polyphaga mimivirus]|uniref:tRNA(His) guanylyltransferase n=1 Tax=Acanthamoeba polyphaga mimivirus Kroon TaxID=3069720 RepID=A0A0G2Y838_9VIRU|nr:putative tRNA(his) guanylyltransferase [Acanthamoeba polyphaga mimivirus]AKI79992.1 putative tRNA(his) guanylyltransferase [Acanthamoeba polyphaga mimivirus Kroon]